MSVRTTEELVDAFATEISWRRKELTELKRLVESGGDNQVRTAAVTRAAVALLYAHWEGIVKRLTEIYLEFVSMQRLRNSELSDSMLAIVIRSRFQEADTSRNIKPHLDLLKFFRASMEDRCRLPYKKVIRTESNLSSTTFAEILTTVGLDRSRYESKFHLIDHSLLAKRNHIAHDQLLNVDEEEYLNLHQEVTDLLGVYCNDLENAAVLRSFQILKD